MLPDSDQIAQDAEHLRAYHAMLDARDVANRCVAHAINLREIGATAVAEIFDQTAATFRALERTNAAAAGVTDPE